MEYAAPIIIFLKYVSSPVSKCFKYHRGVQENMKILEEKIEELNCRKEDVESRVNQELVAETSVTKEVQHWLQRAREASDEVKAMDEKCNKLKYFSRARFGKKVIKKIREVEELYRKSEFHDGLVLTIPKTGDVLPTRNLEGEKTSNKNMEKVWACLMDDTNDRKIGVYGMGGIGKTTLMKHVNNQLLEKREKFHYVFWVTVSRDSSVVKLQDAIAYKLGIHFSEHDDETDRAVRLYADLRERTRSVLILDDLWESYRLEDVGIPEPTTKNGCKLVLTTRSLDVVRQMSCKEIKMDFLTREESLDLFLNTVTLDVALSPNLRPVVCNVAEECACLPLAIVTVAGSLKGVTDPYQWNNALEDLRASRDDNDVLYQKMKFSYDRLKDENLQACFLYCALFPEDHAIQRNVLIEYLIVEGIIKGKKSRKAEIEAGEAMVNRLVHACLLEEVYSRSGFCVKMHDVIRDMAIRLSSKGDRFLVEAGTGLKFIPDEETWTNDFGKVSLMHNDIMHIPPDESPICPMLSTLLLYGNRRLHDVRDKFFLHMKGLTLLDLSKTSIFTLPDSVSDLVNLTALLLRNCHNLVYVPSLEKLTALRKLDLYDSGITEVPRGMEMLVKLRYLSFGKCNLRWIPYGILGNLSNLQFLSLNLKYGSQVSGQEIARLRKLETFGGLLYDSESFNEFSRSLDDELLTCYVLKLGFGDFVSDFKVDTDRFLKSVYLSGINDSVIGETFQAITLPRNLSTLEVDRCQITITSLCELVSLATATNLMSCHVHRCFQINYLFTFYPGCNLPFQRLTRLTLNGLSNLREMIKWPVGLVPPSTFSHLEHLNIYECNSLEKMLFVDVSLPNLSSLSIEECEKLEEIMYTTSDSIDVNLPKLQSLWLLSVPALKSICNSNRPMTADSLQKVKIFRCPKLKRIPFLDRAGSSIPQSLEMIAVDKHWWRSLVWKHSDARDALMRFCEFG